MLVAQSCLINLTKKSKTGNYIGSLIEETFKDAFSFKKPYTKYTEKQNKAKKFWHSDPRYQEAKLGYSLLHDIIADPDKGIKAAVKLGAKAFNDIWKSAEKYITYFGWMDDVNKDFYLPSFISFAEEVGKAMPGPDPGPGPKPPDPHPQPVPPQPIPHGDGLVPIAPKSTYKVPYTGPDLDPVDDAHNDNKIRDPGNPQTPSKVKESKPKKPQAKRSNKLDMRGLNTSSIRVFKEEKYASLYGTSSPTVATNMPFLGYINPGFCTKWLCTVASMFEYYTVHSVKFIYKPTTNQWVNGEVTLYFDADGLDSVTQYDDLQQNAPKAIGKVNQIITLPIPSSIANLVPRRYVRSSTVTLAQGDIHMYDMGKIYAGTTGCLGSDGTAFTGVVGNIWIEWDVSLHLPHINAEPFAYSSDKLAGYGTFSATKPYGDAAIFTSMNTYTSAMGWEYDNSTGQIVFHRTGTWMLSDLLTSTAATWSSAYPEYSLDEGLVVLSGIYKVVSTINMAQCLLIKVTSAPAAITLDYTTALNGGAFAYHNTRIAQYVSTLGSNMEVLLPTKDYSLDTLLGRSHSNTKTVTVLDEEKEECPDPLPLARNGLPLKKK